MIGSMLAEKKPRIVSLLPSATELLCALGVGGNLVGRSHECDYPPQVLPLPVCTKPLIDTTDSSGNIDRAIKSRLQDALSIYELDMELIARLEPSIIVTQTQCEVCAVSLSDVQAALSERLDRNPFIVSLQPNSLGDIWDDIRRLAKTLRVDDAGERLVEEMQRSFCRINTAIPADRVRPKVLCIEWLDPLMTAGNWMPELVTLAGGETVVGSPGEHSPYIDLSLLPGEPEVVIMFPCGFDIPRTLRELPALSSRADFSSLQAVRNGSVFILDGVQYFNRPGPRLVESLEILAEILHPDIFSFGHEGQGWQRL